ncbi:CPBP family intramembrane metalloprotease [Burkholderia stagnalis]|uniref:CPBP family intramembrane metalloprotease n=1 Tax=Burkholderia stagnalis TaxID=1503054 RepID=A0ABX9YQG6_9BURK|nr:MULTISPECIES: CPBP family intramembrane glutamic endopeptidase [Burkholderia]MDD1494046.1 CPBP family intramembrane metalloprotease [Burkholderia thailandensis]RQY93802.1 CPBP family intramembrane metalloprotease [Burkholderia stagnalis]RQZ19524.1 CPBP family intramembrane metalloprotease [Burkholderia stagnalis]
MASASTESNFPGRPGTYEFAKNWRWIALFLGPAVYGVYRFIENVIIPVVVVSLDLQSVYASYVILFRYVPALVFLAVMFYVHRRVFFPDIKVVGTIRRRDVVVGVAAITLVYLADNALGWLMHQPREVIMAGLFQSKTFFQIAVMIGSLLVFPPIVEELAFRHFLLSALPFRANWGIATLAVCATALYFAHVHDYQYWTTSLTMFLVGVVFAIARIRSNGMVLSIVLHAYAIALGLAMDQLMVRIA